MHSTAVRTSRSDGSPSPPGSHDSTTVMRFWVSVPVLSEQITVVDPSVSTAGNVRTIAPRAAMRWTPSASTTVEIATSPSGIAATARDTASMSVSSASRPCARPSANNAAHTTSTATPSVRPSESSLRCMGVVTSGPLAMSSAIPPTCVRAPVATTTPVARPATTRVEENAMPTRSPSATSAGTASVDLSTACDSPVSADSSTRRFTVSISRTSAGTASPAASSTTSPTTSSLEARCTASPSRRAFACGALIARSASSERAALTSCHVPIAAFAPTSTRITIESTSSRLTTAETTAAASNTRIIVSLSCIATTSHSGRPGG